MPLTLGDGSRNVIWKNPHDITVTRQGLLLPGRGWSCPLVPWVGQDLFGAIRDDSQEGQRPTARPSLGAAAS